MLDHVKNFRKIQEIRITLSPISRFHLINSVTSIRAYSVENPVLKSNWEPDNMGLPFSPLTSWEKNEQVCYTPTIQEFSRRPVLEKLAYNLISEMGHPFCGEAWLLQFYKLLEYSQKRMIGWKCDSGRDIVEAACFQTKLYNSLASSLLEFLKTRNYPINFSWRTRNY